MNDPDGVSSGHFREPIQYQFNHTFKTFLGFKAGPNARWQQVTHRTAASTGQDMSERFGHSVDGIEYDFKFLYGCVGAERKAVGLIFSPT